MTCTRNHRSDTRFQTRETALPSVAAAMTARRAQEQQALVQRLTLLPALAGSFAERGTNTPGFTGHEWSWQTMLSLTWALNLTSLGNIRAQDAQLSAATAPGRERCPRRGAKFRSPRSENSAGRYRAQSLGAQAGAGEPSCCRPSARPLHRGRCYPARPAASRARRILRRDQPDPD